MPWALPVRRRSFLPHTLNFFKRFPLCLRDHIVDCEHSCYADCSKYEIGVSWADAILKGGQNQTDLHMDITAYKGQHMLLYNKPLSPFQTSNICVRLACLRHICGVKQGADQEVAAKIGQSGNGSRGASHRQGEDFAYYQPADRTKTDLWVKLK